MFRSCSRCGRTHNENKMCPKYKNTNTKAVKFRNSPAWRIKREEVKKRDNFLCQVCIRNLYEPQQLYQYENLQVHHALAIESNYDLRLENNNLITLCTRHHAMADKYKITFEEIKKIIGEQEKYADTH